MRRVLSRIPRLAAGVLLIAALAGCGQTKVVQVGGATTIGIGDTVAVSVPSGYVFWGSTQPGGQVLLFKGETNQGLFNFLAVKESPNDVQLHFARCGQAPNCSPTDIRTELVNVVH